MTDMRWRGQNHEALHSMINSGEGPRASTPQLEYWEGLKGALGDISGRLNESLQNLGATWEGQAGDSAHRGMTPLRQWADIAQGAADVMRQSVQDQADHVANARAKMPEPVPKPPGGPMAWPQEGGKPPAPGQPPNPAALIAQHGKDLEHIERAAGDAAERAVQVMNQYQSASEHNAGSLAEFNHPPMLELQVGDQVISGGPVGQRHAATPMMNQQAVPQPNQSPTEVANAAMPTDMAGAQGQPPAAPQSAPPSAPAAAAASGPSYTEGAAGTMGTSAAVGALGGAIGQRLAPGGFTGATPGNRGGNKAKGNERTSTPKPAAATGANPNEPSGGTAPSSANQGGPAQQGGAPMSPGMGGAGAGMGGGDTTRGGNPYLANRGLTGAPPNAQGFDPLGKDQPAEGGHTGATAQQPGAQQAGAQQPGGTGPQQAPQHQQQQPMGGGGYGQDMGSPAHGGGMPMTGGAGAGAGGGAGADQTHEPQQSFLVSADNVFGDEEIKVAPPVIGEDGPA